MVKPYKGRKGKRSRKNIGKSRKHGNGYKWVKPFGLSARRMNLPDRMFIKMKYIDNDQNALKILSGDAFGYRSMSGNNLYDPDLKSTGNYGVLGYADWANFYNKYRVHASKISVTFAQNIQTSVGNQTLGRYRCTVVPLDLSLNPKTLEYYKGQPMQQYAKTKEISGAQGGYNQCTITSYMSVSKFEGSMAPKYDISFAATTHGTSSDQSPSNQFYWNIIVAALDGLLTADYSIGCTVRITYYVEYYSRRDLTPSLRLLEFADDNYVPNDEDEAGRMIGATGPTGATGDPGDPGATGATGATGP